MIVNIIGFVFVIGFLSAYVSINALEQGHPLMFMGLAAVGVVLMFVSGWLLSTVNFDWRDK